MSREVDARRDTIHFFINYFAVQSYIGASGRGRKDTDLDNLSA